MTVSRVTRVSNPRRRVSTKRRKRSNPKRLTLKQKLHFGTARQRAAAKAALRNPRRKRHTVRRRRATVRASNPRRRVVRRRKATNVRRRRRVAKANPAYMITLPGMVNPRPRRRKTAKKRRKNTMAVKRNVRRRRRASSTNPRRRRRRNSVRVIVRRRAANPHRRRRANPHRRRRSNVRHMRRRNPALFGQQVGAFEMAKAIAGGLAGVAITKAVPNMLPAGIGGTPVMNSIISVGVAIAAGMAVKALVKGDPILGDAVLFGGLMQAGSVLLNSYLPSVGGVIGLQGLGNGIGDIVAGRFPIPQNPIMAGQRQMIQAPAAPAAGAPAATGVGAIYNPYGRAM